MSIVVERISFKEELTKGTELVVTDQNILNDKQVLSLKPESAFGESILVNIEETGIFVWKYPLLGSGYKTDTLLFKVS